MFNVLNNQTRQLLALKPIDQKWQCITQDDVIFYHADGIVHKAIFNVKTQPYSLLVYEDKPIDAIFEYDLALPINDEHQVVVGKGKPKNIDYGYISRLRTHKLPWVMIDIQNGSLLAQCGMRWLPNIPFESLTTLNNDIAHFVQQHNAQVWPKQLALFTKQAKTRQKYQEGDIFCVNVGPNQYVYCLLIASLMHWRKTALLDNVPDTHYIKSWSAIPIVYRQFDLISERNDLSLEEILRHPLLTANYCMDDLLMRGEFKILHHRDLTAADIDFPISFSVHNRHATSGHATAAGMDITQDIDRNRQILDYYQQHNANVWLTLGWGLAYFQWPLADYLDHLDDDVDFHPHSGMAFGFEGIDPNIHQKHFDALSAFGPDKLAALFKRFGIDCPLDFDAFNLQFSGLSRQAYLDSIAKN